MLQTDEKLIKLVKAFLDEIDRETDSHIMNEIEEIGADHTREYYAANTELRQYLREIEKFELTRKRKK